MDRGDGGEGWDGEVVDLYFLLVGGWLVDL